MSGENEFRDKRAEGIADRCVFLPAGIDERLGHEYDDLILPLVRCLTMSSLVDVGAIKRGQFETTLDEFLKPIPFGAVAGIKKINRLIELGYISVEPCAKEVGSFVITFCDYDDFQGIDKQGDL